MSWWSDKREQARRVAEARRALSVTVDELHEAKAIRADADRTAEDFAERAVTLREIRLRNNITPSIFPAQERST